MAKSKIGENQHKTTRKVRTSIGNSTNSRYTKARHKKQGKKRYRGQGK